MTEIHNAVAAIWQHRDDNYSEIRSSGDGETAKGGDEFYRGMNRPIGSAFERISNLRRPANRVPLAVGCKACPGGLFLLEVVRRNT